MQDEDQNKEISRLISLLSIKPDTSDLPDFQTEWVNEKPRVQVTASSLRGHDSLFPVRLLFEHKTLSAMAALFLVAIGLSVFLFNSGRNDRWNIGSLIPFSGPGDHVSEIERKPLRGVAIQVEGNIQLIRQGQSDQLYTGDTLMEGDRLISTESGRTKISLSEGMLVSISGNTNVSLTQLHQSGKMGNPRFISMDLKRGELLGVVEKLRADDRIETVTPTAVAGVRGTAFAVKVTAESSVITTLSGSVEVKKADSGNAVVLEQGEKVEASISPSLMKEKAAPEVLRVKKEEVAALSQEAQSLSRSTLDLVSSLKSVKTEKEMSQMYGRSLEIIKLRNGRVFRGIVASQFERKLVIHTLSGIHLVDADEVDSIQYAEELPDRTGE